MNDRRMRRTGPYTAYCASDLAGERGDHAAHLPGDRWACPGALDKGEGIDGDRDRADESAAVLEYGTDEVARVRIVVDNEDVDAGERVGREGITSSHAAPKPLDLQGTRAAMVGAGGLEPPTSAV